MKQQINKYNITILYTLATIYFLLINLILPFYENYFHANYILPDSQTYLHAAYLLYKSGGIFHATRPFGYPLIIGIPYLFGAFHQNTILNFAIAINCASWLVSILVLYKTICQYQNTKTAFYITLIFILSFSYTFFIFQAMTEMCFILLVISFAYYLLRFFKTNQYNYLLFSLFCLSFSTVVRPITYYFAIIYFIVCIIVCIKQNKLKHLFIAMLIFCSTIGLQLYKIHQESGKFTISFIQNYTIDRFLLTRARYYKENNKASLSLHSYNDYNLFLSFYNHQWDPYDSLYNTITNEKQNIQFWETTDSLYKNNFITEWKNNKQYIIISYLYNLIENSKNGSFFPLLTTLEDKKENLSTHKKIINTITATQNKLFCIIAIIMFGVVIFQFAFRIAYKNPYIIYAVIITTIIIYLYLTSGISFWQADRFNIVWYPLLLIISPYIVSHTFKKKSITHIIR